MSPDSRHHRGAHPSDVELFSERNIPILRTAVADVSWLLTRGYALTASLKLVGDRYQLRNRQRVALARAACADQAVKVRQTTCMSVQDITGADLVVDGFNLLITIEAALGGGVLLHCRDNCLRDLASVHGTYRSVEETLTAIQLVGEVLQTLQPRSVEWLLDQPVSNSGRLAQKIRKEARIHHWPWTAAVVMNPDTVIMDSEKIAVSSDSSVLDHVDHWVNLSVHVIAECINQAWIIDLQEEK